MAESLTNAAEFTVSELSGALKRTLEDTFGHVRLRGEITGFRGQHTSGHAYFSLKDQNAKIDAVVWKGTWSRLKTKPQEGLEVIATGRITTFPGKSTYQIVVEAIEPAGVGALMAMIEERRRRLTAEGLFEEGRKRRLPYLPAVVGVVTSPTGSVIRDILHRLADRFPRHVLVWPVRVQGETSAAEVAAAITGFNALAPGGPVPRPDVLIVARGGGSLEDLMAFNEEAVVRAAADSHIPLVAAVGHETDWTLIDLAADRRAPTPTGAAEMVVPVRLELVAQVADLARRHGGALRRLSDRRMHELRSLVRLLPKREDIVGLRRQRLDNASARLAPGLVRLVDGRHRRLAQLAAKLSGHSPRAELRARRAGYDACAQRLRPQLLARAANTRRDELMRLSGRLDRARIVHASREAERVDASRRRADALAGRLLAAIRTGLRERRARMEATGQLMASFSHEAVLARGFALVRDAAGQPIHAAAAVTPGSALDIQFSDGHVAVQAGVIAGGPPARPARRGPSAAVPQPSLFDT